LNPDFTGSIVGKCLVDGSHQCPWVYETAGYPFAAPADQTNVIYVVHHAPKQNLENDNYEWETIKFSAIPKDGTEASRTLPIEVNGTSNSN